MCCGWRARQVPRLMRSLIARGVAWVLLAMVALPMLDGASVAHAAPSDPPPVTTAGAGGVTATWTEVQSRPVGMFPSAVTCPTESRCYRTGGSFPWLERSDDGGASWRAMPGSSLYTTPDKLSCTGPDTCLGIRASAVLRTVDGAATWTQVGWIGELNLATLKKLVCADALRCVAIVVNAGAGTALRTVDGGRTWATSPMPFAADDIDCPTAGRCIAVSYSTITVSNDGGATWTEPFAGAGARTHGVSCIDALRCVVAGPKFISTIDGGASWRVLTLVGDDAEYRTIDCAPDGTCLATGSTYFETRTLLMTLAPGSPAVTIERTTTGGSRNGTVLVCNGSTCVLAASPEAMVRSVDRGLSWQAVTAPTGGPDASVACISTERCTVVGGAVGVPDARSTIDGGRTWSPGTITGTGGRLDDVSCGSPTLCLAIAVDPASIVRTVDAGGTWVPVTLPPLLRRPTAVDCPSPTWCVVAGEVADVPYQPGIMDVWVTTDAGDTWRSDGRSSGYPAAVACTSVGQCLLSFVPGAFVDSKFRRREADGRWVDFNSSVGNYTRSLSCLPSGRCTVWTDAGPSVTTDLGRTWTRLRLGVGIGSCIDQLCVNFTMGSNPPADEISTDGGRTSMPLVRPASMIEVRDVTCPSSRRCYVIASGGSAKGTAIWRLDLANGGPAYTASAPVRVLDTRVDGATVDGLMRGDGLRRAGQITELPLLGRPGTAADADVVTLNLTATESVAQGYVTVFPCGGEPPGTSNLNLVPGRTIANAAMVRLSARGSVCLFTSAPTQLIVDVGGGTRVGAPVESFAPKRVLDTRLLPTFDGQYSGIGPLAGGTMVAFPVASRIQGQPASAVAAMLNVTVTDPVRAGFVTVYPCGDRPNASNVNFVPGQTVANSVVVALGGAGWLCVHASATTHVIIDVAGLYLPTGVRPVPPARLLETRPSQSTIDGRFNGIGRLAPGVVVTLPVTGRGGVGDAAAAASLNVTVTEPAAAGYLTVFPCGTPTPATSTVNFGAGDTVANAAVVGLGTNGSVCILSTAPTDVIVDVGAWFDTGPPI